MELRRALPGAPAVLLLFCVSLTHSTPDSRIPLPPRINRIYPVANSDQLSQDLSNVLASDKTAVLRFYADWCPACRNDGVEFYKLLDRFPERHVKFFIINVDHHHDLLRQYKVRGVPTYFILRKNRSEVIYHKAISVGTYLRQNPIRRRRIYNPPVAPSQSTISLYNTFF